MSSKCKQLLIRSWHRLKNLPVSLRVTLWYTLFLSLILVLFTGLLLKMGEDYERRESGKALIKAADKAADRYEKKSTAFKDHDGNVLLSLRDHEGRLLTGSEPEGAPLLPINFNRGAQQVTINGESYHYVDHPVRPDIQALRQRRGKNPPFIRAFLPDQMYVRHYRFLLFTALIALPLFLVLVTLGGYKIIKRSFAPVQAISQAARAIGETGDLSQRIPLDDSQDEIHQMAYTFNWMLEQIEELLEREKRFTSDVSHELRTPTAVIMSESEFGKDYTDNIDEAKDEFRHIFQQSRRMSRLINQLLELSRLGNRKNLELQPVDLSRLITETLEDYQKLPRSQELQWHGRIEPSLVVQGDEQLLHRILGNYLDNALKFARTKITVDLQRDADTVSLTVADDGPGIAEADQTRIWDRLYQADPSRNKKQNMGLGLGLSFVAAAARLMHARTTLESREGKGSRFGLIFTPSH